VDVKYPGDRKYDENVNATKFSVNKAASEITVVDQGNGTVVVIVPGNATGNVTIVVGNQTFNATVINGTAIVNLTNVTPGTHNITVIYSGDDNHTSEIINTTVTINKLITPINVGVVDIYVGDVARINVTVPADAIGKVKIEIDGKEYFADIDNGVARFKVENLTAGVKTVAVYYAGDDNYTANFTTFS
ncbi:Ig-like domain-containing protein, partial [uncultured Methanobrevibacter sp.]|uniref:Ig-like domain-containing protein n=1 Tax=uncultured Methanobrevibacter sp. TaxID=253161 RepID=UPI0025E9389C